MRSNLSSPFRGRFFLAAGRPPRAACLAVAALTLAVAWSGLARAQQPSVTQTSALINEALDQNLDIDEQNRPLPEVLDAIYEATGVRFRVTDETYALLPYGRQTPISATVKNTPLRRTLAAVTQKLGLEMVLRDEALEIRPLPALGRIGRRATVQEVAMLDLLAGVRLDLVEDRPAAWQLLEAVDLKLQDLDAAARDQGRSEPGFAVEVRLGDELREMPVFVPRNATLLDAMEAMHEQTPGTWFPWGDTLVVLPKEEWVRRMIDTPVNLSYNRVDVQQVLHDLQQAAGVPFAIEPGAVQRIPAEFRQVRLFLENATVQEALESISGFTGLGYILTEDGVYIWNNDAAMEAPVPSSRRGVAESPLLLIDLGDGASLLIYAEDLPEDLRGQLEARRQQALEDLRQRLVPANEPE